MGTQTVNREINGLGIGALTISTNSLTTDHVTLGEEHLSFLQSQSQVTEAVPILTKKAKVEMRGLFADGMVWGIDAGAKQIFHLDLKYGRLFRKEDILSAQKTCLVDETMALAFYHRENIVGKKIKISLDGYYETFEIIGVVSSGGNLLQNFIGEYVPSFVYIPYSSMQKTLGQKGFDQIALKVTEETDIEVFTEQIVRQLDEKEGENGLFGPEYCPAKRKTQSYHAACLSNFVHHCQHFHGCGWIGNYDGMLAAVSERTKKSDPKSR